METTTLPFAATAMKCPFPNATPPRSHTMLESRGVHATPSGDVKMTPPAPTAVNKPPPKQTPARFAVVPEVRGVHETASGDVKMLPPSPTATNRLSPNVTPRNACWELVCLVVQVVAFG